MDPLEILSRFLTAGPRLEGNAAAAGNPYHDKAGKFTSGPGGASGRKGSSSGGAKVAAKEPVGKGKEATKPGARAGSQAKALAALKAKTANRPSRPGERIEGAVPKAKKWVDPPPKKGKRGGGKPVRKSGLDSQTAVGDLAEILARDLNFRDVLPKGKRNFTAEEVKKKGSSIDTEYDHSGRLYEIKTCNTTSTEYRLKAKAAEKADKTRYAKTVKAEAWTMVGVHDSSKKVVHFYAAKKPGLTGAEVSARNYDYVGQVRYSSVEKVLARK